MKQFAICFGVVVILFSSLRNFINAIYTRLQNRYDAFEARLVSLEENMSAVSVHNLAAKKVVDNNAVLIAQYSNKLLSLQDEQKHFTIYTEEGKHQMNNFRQQNEHLKELILKQETYSRRPNLIIRGLTLNHKEHCDNVVRKLLVEVMHIPDARHCHTLDKGPLPAVIVRFAFPRQRELVWNKHSLLKSTQFFYL